MAKVILKIEIVVDEGDAEEVCGDVRKLYWSHRVSMYNYKSKTEKITEK